MLANKRKIQANPSRIGTKRRAALNGVRKDQTKGLPRRIETVHVERFPIKGG